MDKTQLKRHDLVLSEQYRQGKAETSVFKRADRGKGIFSGGYFPR